MLRLPNTINVKRINRITLSDPTTSYAKNCFNYAVIRILLNLHKRATATACIHQVLLDKFLSLEYTVFAAVPT